MKLNGKTLIGVAAAAEHYGVGETTIRRWHASRYDRGFSHCFTRAGDRGRIFIDIDALDAYFANQLS